jgi:hypothetical protein
VPAFQDSDDVEFKSVNVLLYGTTTDKETFTVVPVGYRDIEVGRATGWTTEGSEFESL